MSLGLTLNVIVGFSVVDGRWRGREAILDLDFTISHRCKCQFCQKRFSLRVLALRRVCKQMTIVAMRPCCKTGAKVVLRRSTTLIQTVSIDFSPSTLGHNKVTSSAYAIAPKYLLPMRRPAGCSRSLSSKISMYIQNNVGDMIPPCFTPLADLNHFEVTVFHFTHNSCLE